MTKNRAEVIAMWENLRKLELLPTNYTPRYRFDGEMKPDEFQKCVYYTPEGWGLVMMTSAMTGTYFSGLYDATTFELIAESPVTYAFQGEWLPL